MRFNVSRLTSWLEERRKKEIADAAFIDPNAKCPACGNRQGKLDLVDAMDKREQPPKPSKMIRHTCAICSAQWFEECVIKPAVWHQELASL